MYDTANDWRLVVDRRVAVDATSQERQRLIPIEPDYVFQSPTIAFIVTSESAKPSWYRGGKIYQAYTVPFGDNGAAMGENFDVVLNRYTVYRFTQHPTIIGSTYLLSYDAPYYFKDARLRVWEFTGYEGATPESIKKQIVDVDNRVKRISTVVNSIEKKL